MFRGLVFILLLFASFSVCYSADNMLPPEIASWKWNLTVTENFEILTLNKEQGAIIASKVEEIRSWTYKRWLLPDLQFRIKCMVICFPSNEISQNLFRSTDLVPKLGKSKDENGVDRDVYGVWWVADNANSSSGNLSEKIARVCLLNFEDVYHVKFNQIEHVGMAVLNNNPSAIKAMLGKLDPNANYTLQNLIDESNKSPNSESFKATAAAFCLLLKKQQNSNELFLPFLRESNPESLDRALAVFKFNSIERFDLVFNSYVRNLLYDLRTNSVPDMAVTWFVVPKDK